MTKISIVGVEGSGKTVLMAVLGDTYKLPDANGLSLKPDNFETYSYVESQMAELQGAAWPQATTPDIMQTLGWTLQRTDADGNVEPLGEVPFLDFAGEVYRYAFGPYTDEEIRTTPKGDLTAPVRHLRDHVKSSQCLVVLVNLTHVINGSKADRRTQETVWLTQRIVEFAKEAGIPRVALALTQCDRYRAAIAECGGIAGTLRKYLPHVATSFPHLDVFEVAAVGEVRPSADGAPVPCERAIPVGIENLMSFMVGTVAGSKRGTFGKLVGLGLLAALIGGGIWGYGQFQRWRQDESARTENIARQLQEARKRADEAESKAKTASDATLAAQAAQRDAERRLQTLKNPPQTKEETSKGLYKVIDLTDGSISHLDAVPSGGWTDEYKTSKLVLRRIEPGTFMMGSPGGEEGRDTDEDRHRVTLTKPYYMGVFEVTQGQWERIMGGNPSRFKSPTRPVESVSYDDIRGKVRGSNWPNSGSVDADSFLGRLRAKTGQGGFDLPTEAQWEYACRAGTTTSLPNGKDLRIVGDNNGPALDDIAWYGGNSGIDFELSNGCDSSGWKEKQYNHSRAGTHPVGMKRPNAWGLYDMIGNVWEGCADWYNSTYGGDVIDPTGPASGADRVIRGGSWFNCARLCRSAYRSRFSPGYRNIFLGFRLACSAGPSE